MSVESREGTLGKPPQFRSMKDVITSIKRHILASRQESVVLGSPRNHPPYYNHMVEKYMRTGEFSPLFLGTHKSHPGGFPPMEEAFDIMNLTNAVLPANKTRIRGSYLIAASSLRDGGQNEEVKAYFRTAKPMLDKLCVEPLFVVRDKEAQNGALRDKLAQNRPLMQTVRDGKFSIALPEGSVESGRQKLGGKPGEINGMITIKPNIVKFLATCIKEQGMEPLIFFVGDTGENRIYDPNTEKITSEAAKHAIPFMPGHIMSAVVDYPTPYSEIVRHLGINGRLPKGILEQYCGERLAQLLPLNERGVYAEPQLLDSVLVLRRDTTHLFKAA